MNYDVIVMGAGLAGYTSAIRCLENGLRTAVISSGRSALHFSSGSVDLLGALPSGETVTDPQQVLGEFNRSYPGHPYAKLGRRKVLSALEWFQSNMAEAGLPLSHSADGTNHMRITALGTFQSTYLSQPSVEQIPVSGAESRYAEVVVLSIEGYRDFQANLVADNLKKSQFFRGLPVSVLPVKVRNETRQSPYDFRSVNFSALLSQEEVFSDFARQIREVTGKNALVILPAVFGDSEGRKRLFRLSEETGISFHQVATMPPSLLGIGIEEALEKRFTQLGGVLLKGDEVTGGEFVQKGEIKELRYIQTRNLKEFTLEADTFILATGTFFSNGLVAARTGVRETVFGLETVCTGPRSEWYQDKFFARGSHPFLSFGVETNARFQPVYSGAVVGNLYCCGSVLAHYNPVAEGCGGGVAISTAHAIAQNIIQQRESQSLPEAG